jgi:hypothetical protein
MVLRRKANPKTHIIGQGYGGLPIFPQSIHVDS